MKVTSSFSWNVGAKKKLDVFPDRLIRDVADATLTKAIQHIPRSAEKTKGDLRKSSKAYGVQGGNSVYTLGSTVRYASKVWKFNDATTHWTTGNTHSRWYLYTYKMYGTSILKGAIERNMLK